MQIINTIKSIRTKDPKIYDKNKVWIQRQQDDSEESSQEEDEDEGMKKKKKTFKDVVREQILEDMDNDSKVATQQSKSERSTLAYNKEQQDLRNQFLNSIKDASGSESDDDDILEAKGKPVGNNEEEEELQTAIKEISSSGNEKTEEDNFLTEFMSKKKWIPKIKDKINLDDDDIDLAQDEEELDKVDKFESKYNFRFEEIAGADDDRGVFEAGQVVGHARNIADSVRRQDDCR